MATKKTSANQKKRAKTTRSTARAPKPKPGKTKLAKKAKAPSRRLASAKAPAKAKRGASGRRSSAAKATMPRRRPPVSVRYANPPPEPHQRIVRATESLTYVRSLIREVQDFPKPGVLFRDIMPLLANPRGFHIVLDAIAERFLGEHIDAIVGIEARGFIFGGALAARLNASFVAARKPGKLPSATDSVTFDTEYSTTALEMQTDALVEGSNVLIVDDILATGGTATAAAELVRRQGAYVVAYAFVMELGPLNGREKLLPIRVESILVY